MSQLKERMVFADLLRIVAIFGAILIHVSASMMDKVSVNSLSFFAFNAYDSLARFCVPVFVMLSGMLFLNPSKEISVSKIYFKYIKRVFLALLFYGIIYVVLLSRIETGVWDPSLIWDGLKSVLSGDARYHLWYLYMLIGLYIITPFLRVYTARAEKKEIEYFLLLFLIFTGVFYPLEKFQIFYNITGFMDQMKLSFLFGYTGYYFLGYYLYKYPLSLRRTRIIYGSGGLSLFFTIIVTHILSLRSGAPVTVFYSYFSLNVILMSATVFLFFKNSFSRRTLASRSYQIVSKIAGCSFTMYLIHDFFLIAFSTLGITTLSIPTVLSPLILSILIFVLSFFFAYILNYSVHMVKNVVKTLGK